MPKTVLNSKDIQVLHFLQQPRSRYEIAANFGNHYATTRLYIERLDREGFIFVVSSEPWTAGKREGLKKNYLITAKGRSILRGFEEADRRE